MLQWGRQRHSSPCLLWEKCGEKQSAISVDWRMTTFACIGDRGLPCKFTKTSKCVHLYTRILLTMCLYLCRLSLLRYNTNLTRYKNLLFSQSQQLQAKVAFFKTSIQHDLQQYTKQQHTGICEWILVPNAWSEVLTWALNEPPTVVFLQSFRKMADDLAGKAGKGWWVHEGETVVWIHTNSKP